MKNYKNIQHLRTIIVTILSTCTVIALFADVKSTGNLSATMNGAGIVQLVAFVLSIYFYSKFSKGEIQKCKSISKKNAKIYMILAVCFSIFMIIGKWQEANPYLKFSLFVMTLFLGYLPFFYVLITILGETIIAYFSNKDTLIIGKVKTFIFEKHPILTSMGIVFLGRLPYFIFFFPCTMSWDGGIQISNFYGIELFTDHHPPLVSFFYGSITYYSQLWGIPNLGMFSITILQTLLTAFAVGKVIELFKKIKVPYWVRLISLLYYATFSVWGIFDVTIIKDSIYYPFTMLFIVLVVTSVIESENFWEKKRNIILLFVVGFFMCQIRNNGIYILIPTCICQFFVVKARKKIIVGIGLLLCLLCISFVNNVIYPSFGVINLESKIDTYCIMYQQTAKYSIEHPDDVTQEEYEVLNTLFDYEELSKVYNNRLADWVKNCIRIQEGSEGDPTASEFARLKGDYFRVWFQQFLRHPWTYVKAFLECSYGYYYPEMQVYKEGNGFYEMERYTFSRTISEAEQLEIFALPRFLMKQSTKIEYLPAIGLLYRPGFYTWCIMFAIGLFCIISEKKYLIVVVPAVFNILICLISPVNTCMRYVMPTMCMIPIIFGVLIYTIQMKKGRCYES